MTIELKVRDFYSKINFPGVYSLEDLKINDTYINPYFNFYNKSIRGYNKCLDIGCGTGLIANFLAINNPNIEIDAIDFSDSIEYAKKFSEKHNIKNIKYKKQNFFDMKLSKKYDVVICTGVLHHMPQYKEAVNRIQILSSEKIIVGIYNSYAKKIQKSIKIDYKNETYRLDQEEVPYETSFTHKEILKLFDNYSLKDCYPSIKNKFVNFVNLLNYKNGGLTLYEFKN